MNTKFEYEYIGHALANATDEELHIALKQYMDEMKVSKEWMLNYFSEVTDCRLFYYDGSMREDVEDDE